MHMPIIRFDAARRRRTLLSLLPATGLLAACAAPQPRATPAAPASVTAPHPPTPAPAEPPSPPPVRRVALGQSVRGAPLEVHIFGAGPHVLIIGGIHGNEPASAALAAQLSAYLEAHPDAAGDSAVAILPAANPDGLAANRRANAHGVDLNRDFPARNWRPAGPRRAALASDASAAAAEPHAHAAPPAAQPAREPETRALLAALEQLRPVRILSIHSCAPGHQCNNYDGPASGLAESMGMLNGYPVRPTMGYDTPGSLGSWAGVDRDIPVVTLELPPRTPAEELWRNNRDAMLAFIRGVDASTVHE